MLSVERLCLRLGLYPLQYDTFIVLPKVSEDVVIFAVNARLRKSSISRQNDHPFLPSAHPQEPGSINCTKKKKKEKHHQRSAEERRPASHPQTRVISPL